MIIKRYKSTLLYRNAATTMCSVSLAVLLSACGNGSENTTPSTSSTVTGSSSVSAAQLASDDTTTLSAAQAAAAGLAPVASVETSVATDQIVQPGSPSPTLGAANAAEEPTPAEPAPTQIAAAPIAVVAPAPAEPAPVEATPEPAAAEAEPEPAPVEATPEPAPVEATPEPAAAEAEPEEAPVEATPEPAPVEATPEPAAAEAEPEEAPAEAEPEEAPAEAEPEEAPAEAEPEEAPAEAEPEEAPAAAEPATEAVDNANEPVDGLFQASNTEGFVGEVLDDGVVRIQWEVDPTARGYNVYRQAEYFDTVFETEFTDTNTFDESYYYEIQAFDFDDNFNYIATGLTVPVTGTGRVNPDAPVRRTDILDDYELVFSDEFNGTELDSSKWVTQYLWGDALVINSEEQHYVDILNKPDFGFNPFTFDGESVTINSIRTPEELIDKAFGQEYLSGVFTSYDSFQFTYGYVEARVQLPFGKGLWPAFWLLNAFYVDDKPEIDIMEFIGDNQDVAYHTYHYYDAEGELRSTKSEPSVGEDFTNGWHKFAVEWLPGEIIFYVNDVEKHRIIDAKVSQQDMYIIFNTALGGWWPGSPDETTQFPVEYKIDYVRAYQRSDADPVFSDDPTNGRPSELLLWDDIPGVSPSHLPPFELFPEGYPERAVF